MNAVQTFEVGAPEEIFEVMRARGLTLERSKTCRGGLDFDQYVFARRAES